MAPAMSGPTKSSADPDHGASSTCLPSSRVKVTLGSSAAAAMNRDSATDLPAPGSPPSRRLRSGSPIETRFPSSSTPSESGSHSEPVGHGPRGGRGRKRITLKDRDVGERGVGGVTDDPDVTRTHGGGQELARLLDDLGGEPRRQAKVHPLPGGDQFCANDARDQASGTDELAGDQHPGEPATRRPVPQRRGQTSLEDMAAPDGDAHDPEEQDPRTRAVEAVPTRQSTKTPKAKTTSSPHPRTASAIRE